MRKYLYLLLVSAVSMGVMYFLYNKSAVKASEEHSTVLKMIDDAALADETLQKNILESRNFLTLNYDNVVDSSQSIEKMCVTLAKKDAVPIFISNLDLKQDVRSYCLEMEKKVQDVEFFKTEMAVFKNSLLYLHRFATTVDASSMAIEFNIPNDQLMEYRRLVKSAIVFASLSTEVSKKNLADRIIESEKLPESENNLLILHAKKIMDTKTDMDSVTNSIVHSKSEELLNALRRDYLKSYQAEQGKTHLTHKILYAICIVLMGVVMFSIGLTFKYSAQIEDANKHLEERVQDRTMELERTQSTIVQQQQALMASAKLSALGEMAGGVAHEINNPLGIISLRVEQMMESIDENMIDEGEFKKSLEIVARTTMRIAKIVRGLRTFARDGNKDPFVRSSVKDILDDTLSLCGEKFTNSGVVLHTNYHKCSSSILECRPVEMSQVFLNLLNNAYDAVQTLPEKWVSVDVTEEGEYFLIRFKDSGRGIPEHVRSKLMQPFFTTKDVGKGTGLGLSISRGIVESHQGKLYLDVHCDNTCFVVVIPKSQGITLPMQPERQIA